MLRKNGEDFYFSRLIWPEVKYPIEAASMEKTSTTPLGHPVGVPGKLRAKEIDYGYEVTYPDGDVELILEKVDVENAARRYGKSSNGSDLVIEWRHRAWSRKTKLPMPAEQLVRVIHALSEGLVLQTLLTPDLFPKSLYYAAFEALASAPKRATRKQPPE